jgi:hypothetical protein
MRYDKLRLVTTSLPIPVSHAATFFNKKSSPRDAEA